MQPATPTTSRSPDPVHKLHQLDCALSLAASTNTIRGASPEEHEWAMPERIDSPGTLSSPIHFTHNDPCRERRLSGSESQLKTIPLPSTPGFKELPPLPFPFPEESPIQADPTKSPTYAHARMALTGDGGRTRRGERSVSNPAMTIRSHSDLPQSPRNTQVTSASTSESKPSSPSSTTTSRFGFLSTSISALKGLAGPVAESPRPSDEDDLINLNIEQTLHSLSSPTDRSTFSPAAFKNLQMIATGMLHKFQDAYTQRTIEVRELRAEKAAADEDSSEMETKMQHLRMQLEDMARKAAEQEEVMQSLMAELTREKTLRLETGGASSGSSVSEDLGVEEDQRRKWRKSDATSRSGMGYDTDEEGTEEASVFSRSRSPTITTMSSDASPLDGPYPPTSSPNAPPKVGALSTAAPGRQQPQMTTFQKIFKTRSSIGGNGNANTSASSCHNCQGQDVSVAWDTVGLLKEENKGLKTRVEDLEVAVEGALDVINGVGL